ncbi:lysosomal acid glucosylceramidase-like [Schistocerca cancellata]|uniref:lysosomal acid glucosylceramidase-like n=1 Tax=Schistocerca cancellata TaxID=274614 RepID=UPI0021198F26|nr:lysosomal acid glucosylceramidase-like [Schistocerca cancellata]
MIAASALILVLLAAAEVSVGSECAARQLADGVVCVCNATFCDEPGAPQPPPAGSLLHVLTSKAGARFQEQLVPFQEAGQAGDSEAVLSVNRSVRYQEVHGFGGAMTDAAGLNMAALSDAARENLLRAYFAPEGLHYNMARVPAAGTDFSTRTYSYDDVVNDTSLEHFSLADEDLLYKIPYLQHAQDLRGEELLLVAAAWSAPTWMKTNGKFNGEGKLFREYWQLWADYLLRFVEEYASVGLPIWVLSAQNEPTDGNSDFWFNCMGWSATEQRDWVAQHLGPTLQAAVAQPPPDVLVIDDQRSMLDRWPQQILTNETVTQYAKFVGVHWYTDQFSPASMLDDVHQLSPETQILYTEACNGLRDMGEVAVLLGSWERGEKYATSIIEVLNHWSTGWLDWNLALNTSGGPNWVNNNVDSPVIVNATADEFYKQPMFYVLGHFSRFVTRGSVRLQLDAQLPASASLDSVALETPQGRTVLVLSNKATEEVSVRVRDPALGEALLTLPANSVSTLLYTSS